MGSKAGCGRVVLGWGQRARGVCEQLGMRGWSLQMTAPSQQSPGTQWQAAPPGLPAPAGQRMHCASWWVERDSTWSLAHA